MFVEASQGRSYELTGDRTVTGILRTWYWGTIGKRFRKTGQVCQWSEINRPKAICAHRTFNELVFFFRRYGETRCIEPKVITIKWYEHANHTIVYTHDPLDACCKGAIRCPTWFALAMLQVWKPYMNGCSGSPYVVEDYHGQVRFAINIDIVQVCVSGVATS